LLGLNRDIAQTALSDAGLSSVKVTVKEQAAAGPTAMVIAQKPSAGTASVSEIELTVSVPAPMPPVVDKSLQDGRSTLEAPAQYADPFDHRSPRVPPIRSALFNNVADASALDTDSQAACVGRTE